MEAGIAIFNSTLGIATLVGHILSGILLVLIIAKKFISLDTITNWLGKHAVLLSFFIALISLLGSLTYSNIIGFEPCVLCWWQRIFLYPLVILFGVALIRKEQHLIKWYALPLLLVGSGFSTFHYLVQRFQIHSPACDVLGQSASCGGFYLFELGYITIPMMALTVSVLIMLLMTFIKKNK
jgi:disulfide bond formation protein DsbB